MKILELFKGTGSVGKCIKKMFPECEIISLDILKKYKPTICADILEWDYKVYPEGHFDIIWASPECKIFSMLQNTNIGRKWKDKEHLNSEREKNWCFPLKVLEIIKYFKPKLYFIENPYNSAMKDIPQMKEIDSYRFDYCAYGFDYKKPTRIWSNIKLTPKLCNCKSHNFRLGINSEKYFSKGNTQADQTNLNERYSIPESLLQYLFLQYKLPENSLITNQN